MGEINKNASAAEFLKFNPKDLNMKSPNNHLPAAQAKKCTVCGVRADKIKKGMCLPHYNEWKRSKQQNDIF